MDLTALDTHQHLFHMWPQWNLKDNCQWKDNKLWLTHFGKYHPSISKLYNYNSSCKTKHVFNHAILVATNPISSIHRQFGLFENTGSFIKCKMIIKIQPNIKVKLLLKWLSDTDACIHIRTSKSNVKNTWKWVVKLEQTKQGCLIKIQYFFKANGNHISSSNFLSVY